MLTWIALTALLLFSTATYMAGRRKAVTATAGKPVLLHSLPGYYGSYAALWVGVPAALLILLFAMFGPRLEAALLRVDPPAAVAALTAPQQDVFFDDARAIVEGLAGRAAVGDGASVIEEDVLLRCGQGGDGGRRVDPQQSRLEARPEHGEQQD